MKYGSVCSGIEAATMAWHPLGWSPSFFSEIESFPSAVLTHHYPTVPNLGDMTKFEEWPDHAIDLLVGGTPCQDYSVAGLRAGMDGIRGSLTLTYAAIARRYRPRWLAWENVPGVLSLNGGRDFASFLGLLSGQRIEVPRDGWRNAGVVPGYHRAFGLAWRVLDAQYVRVDGFGRAVPQRRRRIFVVGYLGDWRRAAAVLLERYGLCGGSPPRRDPGEGLADRNLLGALDGEFNATGNVSGPITTGAAHTNRSSVVAFGANNSPSQGDSVSFGCSPTLDKSKVPAVAEQGAVRRLTPIECERLQGFPDGFTLIPYRNRMAADGPRYKALGNSMAVNVMRWIGQRIQQVETIARAA